MSESTPTSESASGNATPEPSSKPKKSRNLLMMIAAVIIAVILVAVVFLAVDWGGDGTDGDDDDEPEPTMELVVEITPSGPIVAEAGEVVELYVSSDWVNVNTSESISLDTYDNVTYYWWCDPYDLGSYVSNLVSDRYANFTASEVEATGTLYCNVTYGGVLETAEVELDVNPPYLESVTVVPTTKTLMVDTEYDFTAVAWDSLEHEMTGVSFAWTVIGLDEDNYTLNSTTGATVSFSPLDLGTGTVLLNATGTLDTHTAYGVSTITITTEALGDRTLDYYWYDMFQVPLGEWYYGTDVDGEDLSTTWRPEEQAVEMWDGVPYVYDWYGSEPGNTWNYTLMMLDITGRDMPEINLNEDPFFIPTLGSVTGPGTVQLDWSMRYLGYDESEDYGNYVHNWYDGWENIMEGTTTMDKNATMAVINMPEDQWDTFDTWWATNGDLVIQAWEEWQAIQGNDVYDIEPMYAYYLEQMYFDITAEKVGETVVLTHKYVTWGFEALMSRWICAAFMDDAEFYFEDFTMNATIGPELTDIDISASVQYAAYAYATTNDGIDCWMWEALAGDYVPTEDCTYNDAEYSAYDLYMDETYLNLAPGSILYGTEMTYDYVPAALNLSEGETLRFSWPDGEQTYFHHVDVGEFELVYGPMTVDWTEPMVGEFPGQITVDTTARMITFEGPIDMFAWSRDQVNAVNLADEWDRLGLLPYGAPTIEFRLDSTAALNSALEYAAPASGASVDAAAPVEASASYVEPAPASSAGVSAASEITALVAMAVATILVLLSLAYSVRRVEKR